MADFYFTFGQRHFTKNGVPMKDRWVRIIIESKNKDSDQKFSRELIEEWALENMGNKDLWSMQYTEEEFNDEFFPKGEYDTLT